MQTLINPWVEEDQLQPRAHNWLVIQIEHYIITWIFNQFDLWSLQEGSEAVGFPQGPVEAQEAEGELGREHGGPGLPTWGGRRGSGIVVGL